MEEWLEAGTLSEQEFDQLVRLTARYVMFDVDQFDHWRMPSPFGDLFVDFNLQSPFAEDPMYHRLMWPPADADDPTAWTIHQEQDDSQTREAGRWSRRELAETYLAALKRRWPERIYRLAGPVSPGAQ